MLKKIQYFMFHIHIHAVAEVCSVGSTEDKVV
jgi:hypothetical protein